MTMDTLQIANSIKNKIDILLRYKTILNNKRINNGAILKDFAEEWNYTKPYEDDFLDPIIAMCFEIIDAKIAEEKEELNNL